MKAAAKKGGRRGKQQKQRAPQRRSKIKETWDSMVRVFKYSRKPGSGEYSMFLKVVGLALLVVGGIALVIHLIATLISGVFR